MQGQAADIAIQAEQIVYLKRMMPSASRSYTAKPIERIEEDSDRDRWFTAEEARPTGSSTGDRPVRRGRDRSQLNVALEAPTPTPGSAPHLLLSSPTNRMSPRTRQTFALPAGSFANRKQDDPGRLGQRHGLEADTRNLAFA